MCVKRGYESRKVAKRELRFARGRGRLRHGRMSVYLCRDCSMFHWGHLPANVKHGLVSRAGVYGH